MYMILCTIVLILFMFKVLNAEETPADSEACFNHTVIADSTRLFHYTQTTDNCDSYLVEGWYRFEVDGNPAQIPRACMKSERSYCGTRLPMRLDLGDQSLPGPNSTIPAYACTSFDILGKWDCCVLRQRVWIRNCETFFIYHLRPTDRCDVGYCIQEPGNNPSEEYTAKTGEHTRHLASEMFLQPISVVPRADDMSRDVTSISPIADVDDMLILQEAPTVPPLDVSQHGRHVPQPPCPPWNGFPCINGTRRCHSITGEHDRAVTIIECTNGRGCGRYCDNIADCEDHSDENICPTIACTEGRQSCPSGDACFSRCNGVQECSDGSDEQDCDDEPHEVTISTISVLQLNTTSTTSLDSSIEYESSVFQARSMHGYMSADTLMTDSIRLHSISSSALLPSSSVHHDSVSIPIDNRSVISPTQTVRLQSPIAKVSSTMDSIESDNIPEQTERPLLTVLENSFIVEIPSTSIEMTGMLASATEATKVLTSPLASIDRFSPPNTTADIVYSATASTEIFESSVPTAESLSSSIAPTDIFSSTTTTDLLSSSIATTKTLANISTEVNDSLTRPSRFSLIGYMDNSTPSNTIRITATSVIDTAQSSMIYFHTPTSIITETPIVNSSLESTQMADPAIAASTTKLADTSTILPGSQSSTFTSSINTSSLITTSYQGRPTSAIPSNDATNTVRRQIITSPIYVLATESPSPMYSTYGDYGKIATESISAEPFQSSISVASSSYHTHVSSSLLASSIESFYNSSLVSTVETTTTSVRKMPSVVTFAIIGTAYRKVKLQEKAREPTFEDMLKAAIADVLNEYSDRNRRSVQNFTDQQVHVTNINFTEDDATISLAVNSTKQGESYIPVDELLAVFNNESAIDLLCQKLLLEVHSQLLQTSYSITETSTLPESSLRMTISTRQKTSDLTSRVATTMSVPLPSVLTSSVSTIMSLHVTSESSSRVTSTTSIGLASELSSTVAPATSIHVYNNFSSSVAPTASIQFANASSSTVAPATSIQYASESSPSVAPASLIRLSTSATESKITSSSSISIRQSELFDPFSTQIWDSVTYVQSTQIITSIASSQVSQTDIALNDSNFSSKTKIRQISLAFTTSLPATPIESSSLADQSVTSIPYSSTAGHVISTPTPVLSELSAYISYATPIQPSYVLPVSDSSFKSDSSYLSIIVTPHISTSLIPLHIESSQISQSTSLEPDRVTQHTIQETIQKLQTQIDSPLLSLSPSVQDTPESFSVKIKELSSSNVYSIISTAADVPTHSDTISVASSKHDSVPMTSVYTTTSTLETVTDNQTKDGNQTKDIKSREEDQEGLFTNTGLVVFLIIVVAVILGTCIFALVGTIYRRRMHTWNPQMAYQDAYADIEKDKLSFHRDVLGIESPIPDVDILKSELEQQETSLSKASTMTLLPTPKNDTSQCDVALTPEPSNEYIEINKSGSPLPSRNETDGRGCINKGFEEDRVSGLDGIVPVGEIDNFDPRKSFHWIEQLEDTRL